MNPESIPMMVDPMLARADKIVQLLSIKKTSDLTDEYSQATLAIVIDGLLEPFKPELVNVGEEGNVTYVDFK